MKKKVVALSLVLLLGLTACGSSGKQEAANTRPSQEATVTASSQDTQKESGKEQEPSKTETTQKDETQSSASEASPTDASQASASETSASKESDAQATSQASQASEASKPSDAKTESKPANGGSQPANSASAASQPANSGSTANSGLKPATPAVSVKSGDYLNIALFGLDVNTNLSKNSEGNWKQLMSGFRSDCIMIASINKSTGDVKLVSVYRDTFLNNGNDTYHKANAAYAGGGPLRAVKMLNINLDMNIDHYIGISYHSLMDLVDGLGGITVDVENAALNEINGYQHTIVNDLGLPGYTPVTEAGSQVLNGLQVCAYCRLRHDFPRGDLDRAAHQRKVLRSIEAKVKETDADTLKSIYNTVSGEIATNLDAATLLDLVSNVNTFRIADDAGFPADKMVAIGNLGPEGSCVIPMDLENNVIWLHQFLFNDDNYTPSATVKEIDAYIEEKVATYLKR